MRDGLMQYVPESDDIAKSVSFYGEYASAQLEVLARVIALDAHVIEVGSDIGAHALWLAKALTPDGHLFVFEDGPGLRRMLRQNLEANDVLHRVTMMNARLAGPDAVSAAAAAGEIVTERQNVPVAGLPLRTIDELMLDRLDLIKIAAHVAAQDLIAGAVNTLWRLRPAIFVVLQDDSTMRLLFNQLQTFGYRCWRIETPLFNPGNFNRQSEDIFAGRTTLAMLAVPEESAWVSALGDLVEIRSE